MGVHSPSVAFVHVPKCAGWSVKKYMADHLDSVLTPVAPDYNDWPVECDPTMPKGHLRVADFERYWGRGPESFDLIIGCIRNPYRQQLSQYLYWRKAYLRGGRMVQHEWAWEAGDFSTWLKDPRADYHLTYDYHDHRPPVEIEDASTYEDHGGFYRYWMAVDGEFPDNLRIVETSDLSERLPEIVEPYAGGRFEVPRLNAGGYELNLSEHYTPWARLKVEAKFRWAFADGGYEVWRPYMSYEGFAV